MFRSVLLRNVIRTPVIRLPVKHANFHTTSVQLAKAKKGGGKPNKKSKEVEEDSNDTPNLKEILDLKEIETRFNKIIELFTKTANETKLGKTNPSIFDKLTINTDDGDQPFINLAQTSIKGRKFVITVFDPQYTSSIINSILSSNLNMNPQIDPSNKQTLNIPLPPVTTEMKKENIKVLKNELEKFKTGNKNSSLNSIRSDIKNKLSKYSKKNNLSDSDNKLVSTFEKLHKTHVDKLNEVFKNAEQAILK